MKKEIFPYQIEPGAIMDYVEDRFLLVIKDEDWNQDQLQLCKQPIDCHLCTTADIFIIVVEGGAIDSSDFYFNIQDCDWKDRLLAQSEVVLELVLLNDKNEICLKKTKTLSKTDSQTILQLLNKQANIQFQQNEYEVNVQGIQSAYEPYELSRFSVVSIKL